MGLHAKTRFGFYTVSRDGRQVVSSKLANDLPLQWTNEGTRLARFQWNATGTAIYLEAILNEVRNVWRVRVDPATLEWLTAERLTTGSGPDAAAAISRDGSHMAFTVQRQSTRLWAFPFDAGVRPDRWQGRAPDAGRRQRRCRRALARRPFRRIFTATRWTQPRRDVVDRHRREHDRAVRCRRVTGAWSPDSRTLAYLLEPARSTAARRVGACREASSGGPSESSGAGVRSPFWCPVAGHPTAGSFWDRFLALYTGVAKLALWPVSPPSASQTDRSHGGS